MNEMLTRYPGAKAAARRLALEAVILVLAYLAYEAVRRLVEGSATDAIDRSLSLIRVEQQMGIFFEPALQSYVTDHHVLVTLFNWIYVWGYLPVIGITALYLYICHRGFYARYRNAFLLSGAVGLVIFALLPVAPPRMFPEFGFVDTVRLNSELYTSFEGSNLVNEFAAVPSFHFGWILLVALAVHQTTRRRALRIAAWAMPLLMLLAIVLTGNHYLLDAVAGGLVVLLALGAVLVFEGTLRPRLWAAWTSLRSGDGVQGRVPSVNPR